MSKKNIYLDSFSNVSVLDLKESIRNENGVLNALRINPKVSTFDMAENLWLVDIVDSLKEKGFIVELNENYPWHRYKVTESGIKEITV